MRQSNKLTNIGLGKFITLVNFEVVICAILATARAYFSRCFDWGGRILDFFPIPVSNGGEQDTAKSDQADDYA